VSIELTAVTEPGARFVALAEELSRELAPRAALHDGDGTFAFDSFELLRARGYFRAPVPVQFGGLGASSVHDVVVGASRLARGDASLTIGSNMHFAYVLNVVRRWEAGAEAFAPTLHDVGRAGTVFAAAVSEPGQDITRPATTAVRENGGWVLNGRKTFCTMSPAADILYAAVGYTDDRGRELYGYAIVPRDIEGVVVHGDWDALGMRASGSHSVTFESVALPKDALRGGFPLGDAVAYMERNLAAGLLHAAAALGIAEGAHAAALRAPDGPAEALLAQQVVDLSASRGALARAALLLDAGGADVTALFAETQAAKAFVSEAAVRIVDRALALSGGAGYVNGSPLARAYRDVRATAFMHPLGANRAPRFLASVELGREPELH
jgi:L-evernosamine nitrososynthase